MSLFGEGFFGSGTFADQPLPVIPPQPGVPFGGYRTGTTYIAPPPDKILHLDLPMRYSSSGKPAVVEQDSVKDIDNCIEAILRTHEGQRTFIPGFGIPELVFQMAPIKAEDIVQKLLLYEPRSQSNLDQALAKLDALITEIRVDETLRR